MKKYLLLLCLLAIPFSGGGAPAAAQEDSSRIRVSVVLVQLNVAVTDNKGNYIGGLKPEDFIITEDKIPEKTATFEEGNGPTLHLVDTGSPDGKSLATVAGKPPAADTGDTGDTSGPLDAAKRFAGANVFILFDTSNYMYRGFVFAQDAIADFVRSLEGVSQGRPLLLQPRPLPRRRPHPRPLPGPARRAQHRSRRRRRPLQRPPAHRQGRRPSQRPQSHRRLLQRPRQRQPRPPRGRRRARPIHRHHHLHDQHPGRPKPSPSPPPSSSA